MSSYGARPFAQLLGGLVIRKNAGRLRASNSFAVCSDGLGISGLLTTELQEFRILDLLVLELLKLLTSRVPKSLSVILYCSAK
jgi:hypothetical protein